MTHAIKKGKDTVSELVVTEGKILDTFPDQSFIIDCNLQLLGDLEVLGEVQEVLVDLEVLEAQGEVQEVLEAQEGRWCPGTIWIAAAQSLCQTCRRSRHRQLRP